MRHAAKILIAQRQKVAHGRAPIPTKIILCRKDICPMKATSCGAKTFFTEKNTRWNFFVKFKLVKIDFGVFDS